MLTICLQASLVSILQQSLAPVVQRLEHGIMHRINCHPAVKCKENKLHYLLDSDLPSG